MGVIINVLISVLIVSLVSLIGVITLGLSNKKLKNSLLFLVSLAAGALLGDVFIHLIPEIAEETGFNLQVTFYILSGIIIFFVLEKFLHWHHCHDKDCETHNKPLAFMNIFGDSLHNFVDGVLIAGSYLVNFSLGVATTIAVIFHEIPQEIGDYGVLLHSGYSKSRALLFNFLTALTAFFGAILALIIQPLVENFTSFILPITAGGFLYIAGSDLIPELHKDTKFSSTFLHLIGIILGVLAMYLLLLLE